MLHGTGYTAGYVEAGAHRVAGLPDLMHGADPAEINGTPRGSQDAAEFPGALAEGYYGGFLISEHGQLLPVKGLVFGTAIDETAPQPERPAKSQAQDTQDPDTNDIIGPDIQGDDWTGTAFLQDGHGVRYNPTNVSAVVTQENDQVTITLTFLEFNLWGISEYFWGTIFESGHMTLYDELSPPETWTTHFGPATETSITAE